MSGAAAGLEWDAASYGALALPHEQWGRRTLARLPLAGDETVLEIGCGTGRDAAALLAAVPRGRLIALDGSAAMVAATRSRLAGFPGADESATVLRHDLREPLPLPDASLDAVFSVATLHWLDDHPALFAELARVVRAGGRLALEYGGAGNIAEVNEALAALGVSPAGVRFATPEEEHDALVAAGFVDVETRLRREEPHMPGEDLETFLRTIVLRPYLAEMPAPDAAAFVREVARRLPGGAVTYVRMEVAARRG
jgi:trans-aconitate 2-methyltransferase